jgi:hypothetical protein
LGLSLAGVTQNVRRGVIVEWLKAETPWSGISLGVFVSILLIFTDPPRLTN